MMAQQLVTITFFKYQGGADKWWAFKQMGLAGSTLNKTPGLQFSKLLGSGGFNGFSIWPNLSVYGLLGVWRNQAYAQAFFSDSQLFQSFQTRTQEHWTVYMQTIKAHGQWDGQVPFVPTVQAQENQLLGVITRATIHPKHLWRFWRFVPPVSRSIKDKKGLIFAVGIGELPLIQQATFSLWENSQLMKAYAYQSGYHKKVVRKTREIGWYKEELFARFHPFHSEGTWHGKNPICQLLPNVGLQNL